MDMEKDLTSKTNEELLLEYKKTKELRIKQELTLRYVPIVKRVAIQMRDVYVSFAQLDDILNEGVLAIMSAIDKYDIEKNIKFESYIAKRIRGMVIDVARKNDWIPRGARKNARNIDNVINTLYNEIGREPTEQEIADYLGMSVAKYNEELKKANIYHVLSLDMVLDESSDRNWGGVPSGDPSALPEQKLLEQEQKEHLVEGIKQLRENEQMVISLYYQKEVNIKTIAQIMKVSEPRISQIHGNAEEIEKVHGTILREVRYEEKRCLYVSRIL